MQKKILLIEDEIKIQKLIVDYFKRENFLVSCASDGLEGLELFSLESPDLVILDVMLPKMDGWSVLARMRKSSDVPVIMLTARNDEEDKLMGFDLKADEYVTKPFSPRVLVARATMLLMRASGNVMDNQFGKKHETVYNGILVNEITREVKLDGKDIELSKKEYDLLNFFMQNPGRVFSRQNILDKIWGYEYFGDERVVDTHVKKLRKKLADRSYSIKTIFGVGYKFEVRS